MICLDRNLPPVNTKLDLDKPDDERPTASQNRESRGFQHTPTEGVDVNNVLDAGSD